MTPADRPTGDSPPATKLPPAAQAMAENYPQVWQAFEQLGLAINQAAALDPRSRRLVHLALALGGGSEGATHSHARRGLAEGCSRDELEDVALLAITTLGWPQAIRGLTWIRDITRAEPAAAEPGQPSPPAADALDDALAAAAFRRLRDHLRHRSDIQNVDLMGVAGFCRNCLADWLSEAAGQIGQPLDQAAAREMVYGMPYDQWKAQNQRPATAEQLARMEENVAKNAG